MLNQPIIRIEIDRLRHSIHHMLGQHVIEADAYIKAAIDDFCKPDRIERFVQEEATRAIGDAVKEEVASFFRYGAGREAVKKAVVAKLSEKP